MKTSKVVPFVVSVDAGTYYGEAAISFVGIVLALCRESAFEQAMRRWRGPGYTVLEPEHWENVSPELRLLAIEADLGRPPTSDFILLLAR